MISISSFLRILELSETVGRNYTTDSKGMKSKEDFTELTYDNVYEYCRYMGYEGVRPKIPADIIKIAKEIGF